MPKSVKSFLYRLTNGLALIGIVYLLGFSPYPTHVNVLGAMAFMVLAFALDAFDEKETKDGRQDSE